ncbi:MAG TPA: thiosulfate oxidation carrier protein SoxY [Candidatus Tyrphobacter sp.]
MKRSEMLVVTGVGGAAMLASAAWPGRAWATPDEARAYIASTLGPGTPVEGKVTLEVPDIAENGANVPVTITVDSPMTESAYVKTILLVADGNPNPGVARFDLSPANGKASIECRIRLAQTENVIAIAQLNDGSLWSATKHVKVTIGGCGG